MTSNAIQQKAGEELPGVWVCATCRTKYYMSEHSADMCCRCDACGEIIAVGGEMQIAGHSVGMHPDCYAKREQGREAARLQWMADPKNQVDAKTYKGPIWYDEMERAFNNTNEFLEYLEDLDETERPAYVYTADVEKCFEHIPQQVMEFIGEQLTDYDNGLELEDVLGGTELRAALDAWAARNAPEFKFYNCGDKSVVVKDLVKT